MNIRIISQLIIRFFHVLIYVCRNKFKSSEFFNVRMFKYEFTYFINIFERLNLRICKNVATYLFDFFESLNVRKSRQILIKNFECLNVRIINQLFKNFEYSNFRMLEKEVSYFFKNFDYFNVWMCECAKKLAIRISVQCLNVRICTSYLFNIRNIFQPNSFPQLEAKLFFA